MDNTQQQFINILSKVIMNKSSIDTCQHVSWDELINLAKIHKVEGLIYSAVINSELEPMVGTQNIKKLKDITFYTAATQMRNIVNLDYIFQLTNKANIPVIALKGLVLRNLYPEPELRSMCDADILVRKDDLEKLRQVLVPIGYRVEEEDSHKHWQFVHDRLPLIEAHWNGCSNKEISNKMWDKAIPTRIMKEEIFTLNYDDFLLYLCIHMAEHMAGMGFGVRQLCDFVLYVEKYKDEIDWESFNEKSKVIGLERFQRVIFALCKKIFNLNVPNEIHYKEFYDEKYLDILMEDILCGGVYGRSNRTRMLSNSFSINAKCNSTNSLVSMGKKLGSVMNPTEEALEGKYDYARRSKILRPVAGIHKIYNDRVNTEGSILKNMKPLYKAMKMSNRKSRLIQWMGL